MLARRLTMSLVVIALGGLAACSAPASRAPASLATPSVATSFVASLAPDLEGQRDGLLVTVDLDHDTVEPGGDITATVSVRNDRSDPATLLFGLCGAVASVHAEVPIPWDPTGRDWDGIAAEFKRFVLTEGMQPGIVSASLPERVDAIATPCPEMDGMGEETLGPGETKTSALTWAAALAKGRLETGVPAQPGEVPYHVDVVYDPEPPPPTPVCNQWCGNPTGGTAKVFTLDGAIQVEGPAPKVVTAGQAVDALLGDAGFGAWLAKQPRKTWSGTNVYLQNWNGGGSVVPKGLSWDIELFREKGVPRNWAMAFVDPFTGEVRRVEYCNKPCDR
jgi:hypothetical protein